MMWDEIQAQVFDGVIAPEILTAKEIQETWERVGCDLGELGDNLCIRYDEIMADFLRENVVDEAPSFDIVKIPKPVIQPTVDTNTVQQVQDTVRRRFMNGSIGFDARAGEDVLNLDNGDWLPVRGHRMSAAEQALMEWKVEWKASNDLHEHDAIDAFYRVPYESAVSARDIVDALERVSTDARTSIQFQNGSTMLVIGRDETGAFDALANSLSHGGTLADFVAEQKESERRLDEFFDEFPDKGW